MLKMHDGEYFEVTFVGERGRVKLNFCYSVAYKVPVFYFMAYDENSQPLTADQIHQ
jgi:hypothetical protein